MMTRSLITGLRKKLTPQTTKSRIVNRNLSLS
jgi:hypothetical protein